MKKMWINGELMSRHEIAALAQLNGVPEHCCDSLAGYITGEHKYVGGFLAALLSNNLKDTFARADDINRDAIFQYLRFLHNYAPSGCWGSEERFFDWRARDNDE